MNLDAWIVVALAAGFVFWRRRRRGESPAPSVVNRGMSPGAVLGLLAGAAAAGWLWAGSGGRKAAAPASVPSPSVTRQVITRTVTRYVNVHNWPVSGLEIVLIALILSAAAIWIVRLIVRYVL